MNPSPFSLTQPIISEVICLRQWQVTDDDIDVLVEAFADPQIRDSVASRDQPVPDDPLKAFNFVHGGYERAEQGAGLSLAVCARDDDRVVGGLDLDDFDDLPDELEVGYWVLPAERKHGVATAALGASIDWLVERGGVSRLWAGVRAGNLGSIVVLRRCGFGEPGGETVPAHLAGERDVLIFQRKLT
jgi:RimJ/RimL family protein N-acetyltransferase